MPAKIDAPAHILALQCWHSAAIHHEMGLTATTLRTRKYMTKAPIQKILRDAKNRLLNRLVSGPRAGLHPNGTPADPIEFHRWSVARHAEARAPKMNISGKPRVLLPEIAELDVHLRTLEISHTDITDLSPLRGLPHLRHLKIIATPVTDLQPLGSLTRLETLELTINPNCAFALPDLPYLRRLKLYCPRDDISLGTYPKLEYAEFQVLSDLTAIAQLSYLKELKTQKLIPSDLIPLSSAKQLTTLDIRLHGPVDLAPLSDLRNLETLRMIAPEIDSISKLASLTNLKNLDLSGTPVTKPAALKNLTKLNQLRLSTDTPLDRLDFLAGMTRLTDLTLCPSQTADLTLVARVPELRHLGLFTLPADLPLDALSACPALNSLVLSADKSSSTRTNHAIPAPRQLKKLVLWGRNMTQLDGLESCKTLQELHCHKVSIADLTPLEGLPELTKLSLAGSNVSDLSALLSLPKFLSGDPAIQLSLKDTPAAQVYAALATSIAIETGRDAPTATHQTAIHAVQILKDLNAGNNAPLIGK